MQPIERFLNACSEEERRLIFNQLRKEFRIHQIEEVVGMDAERILEAFSRAVKATPMLMGILAEPAFEEYVLKRLPQDRWSYEIAQSGQPYDFVLKEKDAEFPSVSIQVKLQKGDKGTPVYGKPKATKYIFSTEMLMVETQRSRKGSRRTKAKKEESAEEVIESEAIEKGTRPYKFGQFDIIAVSLFYSEKRWDRFMFTLCKRLLPDPENLENLATYQPVSAFTNDDWTDSLEQCLAWHRAGRSERIRGGTIGSQRKLPNPEQSDEEKGRG